VLGNRAPAPAAISAAVVEMLKVVDRRRAGGVEQAGLSIST